MNINEDLTRIVFDEMVKYKPGLAKYLEFDREEEEDVFDYRILSDLIIKNFPWPIGVELRRLFSASMRSLDRMRLDQIFRTLERTMQFLSFVMISLLWKEKQLKKIKFPEAFCKEFQSRFVMLSMGDFACLVRSISEIFEKNKLNSFIPEFNENFDKKFLAALDFWTPKRNEIGHYQINLTQEEIEKRCVEYEEKLAYILQKIAFFTKYRLVSVRKIKVNKYRDREPVFQHFINLLNSSDSDFKAEEIEVCMFSESSSILLMRTIKNMDEYINLSPLLIDTHSEVIDNKEKFSIKKDIFLYSKFKNDHLFYNGTEVTEKCDLRLLSNYNILLDEYKALYECFSA
jgi:hypothetical protein